MNCYGFCLALVNLLKLEGVHLTVITRIKSGWFKFRDVVSLLANGSLP